MRCPVGRDQAKPCHLKYLNGFSEKSPASCFVCLDEWSAYAAKIEFDAKQTRAEAERQATEQLREQLEERRMMPDRREG